MRASHALSRVAASFDEPNPVSCAGLMPVLALATGVGSESLTARHLTVPGGAGHPSGAKVTGVVAGMVAGADTISDLNVLRHGGMSGYARSPPGCWSS